MWSLAYLATGQRRFWWLAAVAAALTTLARYAAVPLIGAVGLALLVYGPGKRAVQRVKDALLFGLASLAPVAAVLAAQPADQRAPGAVPGLHFRSALTRDQLTWFLYHWLSLFVPGRLLRGREVLARAGCA